MNMYRMLAASALFLTTALPVAALASPVALETGSFVSGVHMTSGTATIYKLPNGKRFLRLMNFETSNGPKVHVVLADHMIKGNSVINAHSVDLGDLKGTSGNQNYAIPADVKLSHVKSVSIYCERFHVSFGAAQLK